MANTTHNANKTDPSPESTWGANKEAKEKWERAHGSAARRATGATREGAPGAVKEASAKEEDDK